MWRLVCIGMARSVIGYEEENTTGAVAELTEDADIFGMLTGRKCYTGLSE